ncbi:MAG TPA: hypothetical protein VES95_12210 [Dermatophilaceae bacterium]|nr:hypothetical protein [Dermatophilaceae bacterium]
MPRVLAALLSPRGLLALVSGAFLLDQVVFVAGLPLGWDESIYASQTDPRRPALLFTAPRARGTAWLAWPVSELTASPVALRVWFALLSAVAAYLAYAVWLRVLPGRAVPLAALLLTTLWTTIFYGPTLMPNVLVALAGVAVTGALLRVARGERSRHLPWVIGGSVAGATLIRPGDLVPLVGALALAVGLVPAWRRRWLALLGPVAAGAALGAVPWLVEAQLRYGSVPERVRAALRAQSTGERFVPDYQLRSLDGPLLCRPCVRSEQPVPWEGVLLWGVGAALVALAVVLALRGPLRDRQAAVLLPAVTGAVVAVPYLLLVGYGAPRFLLSAYALLALPAASALTWLVAPRGRVRLLPAALVAALLLGHVVVQTRWLEAVRTTEEQARAKWAAVADGVARAGVTPPCTLLGPTSAPIAYLASCDSVRLGRPGDERFTLADLDAVSSTERVALVLRGGQATPDYARGWTPVTDADLPAPWRMLVPPGTPR